MKKKILIRGAIGVLIAWATVCLIPTLIGRRVIYSDQLLARAGSPLGATLLTLLIMGLFGAVCLGGTIFYEIERWPLALATAAHYLAISLGYLLPARALCWELTTKLLLGIEGCMTVGFFLIWLTMYLIYRAQVRKLNELIRERGGKTGREQTET